MQLAPNQAVPFTFESHTVRVVGDDRGEPWFIAADVCAALGHSNPSVAVSRLDADEKGVSDVYTPGGPQRMTTVSEPGVYRLVFTSRTEAAERFKRWVAHEVLPAIRKTGSYSAPAVPQDYEAALEALLHKVRENKLLAAENADKGRALAVAQPAVAFVEKYVEAKSTKCIRDVAKVLGIRERDFIATLQADGVLFRQSGRLRPYAQYVEAGYFELKTGVSDGSGHAFVQPKFTPAGIAWAAQRYGSPQQPEAHPEP